jgi:hypothetical protein
MACTKLFRLHRKAQAWISGENITHSLGLVANDDHHIVNSIESSLNHIANHRHPGYLVQHLRFIGMHAGPLSRSEYDGTDVLHEPILPKKKGQVN